VKAIVIERPDELAMRELPDPSPGPDDVVIASAAVGICRTDVHILHGEMPKATVRYPCIPGHEWSGTIALAGERVRDLSPGDRVVSEGRVPCLRCARCAAGETNLCVENDQLGFTRPGGGAELVVVPARVVHRLPEGVSHVEATLVEPMSIALRALRRVSLTAGETSVSSAPAPSAGW
jgi:D-arabinose 1-dehydrogenase-like Zn-dependent alcohol dehydrogenase